MLTEENLRQMERALDRDDDELSRALIAEVRRLWEALDLRNESLRNCQDAVARLRRIEEAAREHLFRSGIGAEHAELYEAIETQLSEEQA